jgi:hypothetical protein
LGEKAPEFFRIMPNDSFGYGDHIGKYLIFWIIIDNGRYSACCVKTGRQAGEGAAPTHPVLLSFLFAGLNFFVFFLLTCSIYAHILSVKVVWPKGSGCPKFRKRRLGG